MTYFLIKKITEKWDLWVPWLKSCWKVYQKGVGKVAEVALFTPFQSKTTAQRKKKKEEEEKGETCFAKT